VVLNNSPVGFPARLELVCIKFQEGLPDESPANVVYGSDQLALPHLLFQQLECLLHTRPIRGVSADPNSMAAAIVDLVDDRLVVLRLARQQGDRVGLGELARYGRTAVSKSQCVGGVLNCFGLRSEGWMGEDVRAWSNAGDDGPRAST
jgi:hypothetical protein